jgi:hypothetical protein
MKKMHLVNIAGRTAMPSERVDGGSMEPPVCGGVPWS